MPRARQSSRTLSRSSVSGFSSSAPTDIKNDVGGICLGSPTIIALLALASEGTASHVGSCEASSKITISNRSAAAGRYCDTVNGDISIHGATTFKSSGISPNRLRKFSPRKFPLVCLRKDISSKVSAPSVSSPGNLEIRSWRILSRVSLVNSSKICEKLLAVSSRTVAESPERRGSAGMFF